MVVSGAHGYFNRFPDLIASLQALLPNLISLSITWDWYHEPQFQGSLTNYLSCMPKILHLKSLIISIGRHSQQGEWRSKKFLRAFVESLISACRETVRTLDVNISDYGGSEKSLNLIDWSKGSSLKDNSESPLNFLRYRYTPVTYIADSTDQSINVNSICHEFPNLKSLTLEFPQYQGVTEDTKKALLSSIPKLLRCTTFTLHFNLDVDHLFSQTAQGGDYAREFMEEIFEAGKDLILNLSLRIPSLKKLAFHHCGVGLRELASIYNVIRVSQTFGTIISRNQAFHVESLTTYIKLCCNHLVSYNGTLPQGTQRGNLL